MRPLDDEADFGWKCAWCGHPSNMRHLVYVTKIEVFDYFTGETSHAQREYTFCSNRCVNKWYGP